MFRRLIPVVTALVIPFTVWALPPDVLESDWYSNAVVEFVESGYLNESNNLRPGDLATRGEFVKLMVELKGGVTITLPEESSFYDVLTYHDYFPYFEEAAHQGWMKGVGSCLGSSNCLAKPYGLINRAESAALLGRAFGLGNGDTPDFEDNPSGEWFTDHINLVASACVLKGDGGSKKVRPADNMNRAEMIVMLRRIHANLRYPNCDESFSANVLPDFPVRNQVTNEVQQQVSPTPFGNYCTEDAWVCGGWGLCNPKKGIKTRPCELIDFDCNGPGKVSPVESQGCVKGRTPDSMQEFVYYGYDLVRDMEATAYMVITTYSMQILDVMRRYEKDLTRYAGITRNALVDKRWINESIEDIKHIEKQLEALESEYNRIEKVFRRPTGTGFQDELLPLPSSLTDPTCEDLKRSINVYKRWDDAAYIRRALVATGCMLEEDYCRMYGVCAN